MSNQNNQAGKGSRPRPVKKSVYDERYDAIDWGRPKKSKKSKSKVVLSDTPTEPECEKCGRVYCIHKY